MFTASKNARMIRTRALGFAVANLFAIEAQAETRVFGCNLVENYSSAQVSSALFQAKAAVGLEAVSLYRQYLSLKNECRTNPGARRSVRLSPEMVALISN
jgi:hypothetical protein